MSVPNATFVATSFVKQYYGILAQEPDKLHKFYKAQSVFSFCTQGGVADFTGPDSTVTAVGQEDIHTKIMATLRPFNGHSCKAEIVGIDSQESRQGGVLVLVTGYLVIVGTPAMQHFTQSFFLDKQTLPYEGYFVLNDILRYLPPLVTNVGAQPGPMMSPEAYFQAQGQPGGPAAAQDVNDDEADERVAEVSLDIEDDEEEEERHGDEEVEAGAEGEEPEGPAGEEAEEVGDAEGGEDAAQEEEVQAAAEETSKTHGRWAQEAEGGEGEGEQLDGGEGYDAEAPAASEETSKSHGRWAQEAEGGEAEGEQLEGGDALAGYYLEEAPRTWASMAGRLQQEGGGQLRASKVQGFGCPAAPRVLPPAPAPAAGGASASGYAGAGGKAGKGGGSSSSRPAAPAGGAQQGQSGNVWLWVSRLPTDPAAETQEVLDGLNSFLIEWGCEGRAVEVDRRDPQQEWASISVTSQEAAETLIALSKDRGLLLRNKPLKAELHRMAYSGPRRQGRGGGGEGRGAARGGAAAGAGREDDRHDSGKGGDSRGGGRPRRKPRGPVEGRERYGDGEAGAGAKGEAKGEAKGRYPPGDAGAKGFGRGGHK